MIILWDGFESERFFSLIGAKRESISGRARLESEPVEPVEPLVSGFELDGVAMGDLSCRDYMSFIF